MSNLRCVILIVFVLVTNGLQGANPLVLSEAIKEAIQNSPALDSKRRNLTIAEFEIKNKFAQFLPQLDFKSEHGLRYQAPRKADNDVVSNISVVLSENIYDSGRSQSAYRIAKLQLESQQIGYDEQRDQLILDVTMQFFQMSLKSELILEAEQKANSIKKQYDLANQIYRQGLKRMSDVQRLKAQMERAEIGVVQLRNDLILAMSALRILLGQSSDSSMEFALTNVSLEGKSFDTWVNSQNIDFDTYYSIRRLKVDKRVQEERLELARSVNSPEIKLASTLRYGVQDYIGPVDRSVQPGMQFFAGIEVNFPIWDWGSNRRTIENSVEELAQSADAISAERNSISDKVKNALQGLKLAARTYQLNEDLLKIEQENFSRLVEEYKTSKASILDVITATDNLATARTSLLQSFYDKISFQAQLLFYQGKIHDWAHR